MEAIRAAFGLIMFPSFDRESTHDVRNYVLTTVKTLYEEDQPPIATMIFTFPVMLLVCFSNLT
jgi:hypothetical protein